MAKLVYISLPWLIVAIPFPASGCAIPQHLLVHLHYISDSIMSLFGEPTIRRHEKVIWFFLLPECLMILLPELVYHKDRMVPEAAHGLEQDEGVWTWRQQTTGSASTYLLAARGEKKSQEAITRCFICVFSSEIFVFNSTWASASTFLWSCSCLCLK